ncbi:hypothetical protein A2704_03485 [Candidatus Kaiserbacteria bacterium RIFCSPHIGHO2_01_FULL_54_36b]|uniref:Uncharacterized protein n=1 Tax=Candidatus Kaiserbacteria bacterium RIFCSPHIGHO2_01_FULL_54_36b TaxID=1798483 RepID=A0A1F6CQI3_9BACT|nr:MAG: hypothetical protein A2704_03485 [Candidatus Kaiserbacteria bacterium RIFCSPHIGHO2_01_FULL_54_36b]
MHTQSVFKTSLISVLLVAAGLVIFSYAFADSAAVDFESPPYTLGDINGQDGWIKTGAYDHEVSSSFGVLGFGAQSLRVSNAMTSGAFDQTFAKPLADAAGEADSTDGAFSRGTLQNHFEAEFDIRAMQLSQQVGLQVDVSPDRGDGSRMSFLRFNDLADGIHVIFFDVTNPGPVGTVSSFDSTDIATLSRAITYRVKFEMDFIDGPGNDVVKIYIDGVLVHTGTSWEDYYRYDPEAAAEQSPRIVKTLLFHTRNTAAPDTLGLGYLFDNVSLNTSTISPPPDVTVTIVKYMSGVHATAGNANSASFPMASSWDATNIGAGSGTFSLAPATYEAQTSSMTSGADYATNEDTSTSVVGADCASSQEFHLLGYTTGDSLAAAAAGSISSTSPAFTGITTDKWVIVWNEPCPTGPPPAPAPPENACSLSSVPGYTVQTGTSASETVTLAPNTMFRGNGGNDTITGPDGNYIICTGSGSDTITLGHGDSTIDAGAGNNIITTGDGSGYITTGSGSDTLTTGTGAHTISAGSGSNTITTGSGDQNITSGSGPDTVTTAGGNDTILAGSGSNIIQAGAGDDTVTTGSGSDSIDGGADTDTCSAGAGNNTVVNCSP